MQHEGLVVVKVVAWVSTLVCVFLTIQCAKQFLTHNSRLFSAVALFALSWALLLPYYGNVAQTELFPAFGGFVFVFVGQLIGREARLRKGEDSSIAVEVKDRLALWLLLLLAGPSLFSLAGSLLNQGALPALGEWKFELVCATFLDCLGYVSIASGLGQLLAVSEHVSVSTARRARTVVWLVTISYCIAEVGYTIYVFSTDLGPKPVQYWTTPLSSWMEAFYFLFAALKISFATSVNVILIQVGMEAKVRQVPLWGKLMILLGHGFPDQSRKK